METIRCDSVLIKIHLCLLVLACIFGPSFGFIQMIPDNVEVGSCAKPNSTENFAPEKYAGTWYHVQEVPNSFVKIKQCTAVHITRQGADFATTTTGLDWDGLSLNQTAIITSVMPVDPTQPKPFLKVIAKGVPPVPYHILETDYTHYSCVYSCFEFLGLKVEVFFVLSRKISIRKQYLDKCISAYEALELDASKLEPVHHGEICNHPLQMFTEDPKQQATTLRQPEKDEGSQGHHKDSEGIIAPSHDGGPNEEDYDGADPYLYDPSYLEFGLASYESYGEDPNYDTKSEDLPMGEDQGSTISEDEEKVDSFSDTLVAKAIGGETRHLDRELRHEAPLKTPRLRYNSSRKGKRRGKSFLDSRGKTSKGISSLSLTTSTPLPYSTPFKIIVEPTSDVTKTVHSDFVSNTSTFPTDIIAANINKIAVTARRKSSTASNRTAAMISVLETTETATRSKSTARLPVRQTAATNVRTIPTSALPVRQTTDSATKISIAASLPPRQTAEVMNRITPTPNVQVRQTTDDLQISTSIQGNESRMKDFNFNNSSVSKVSSLCILICMLVSCCGGVLFSSLALV